MIQCTSKIAHTVQTVHTVHLNTSCVQKVSPHTNRAQGNSMSSSITQNTTWKNKQNTKGQECISCTLRSGVHEISTMIRTFPCGLENNHSWKIVKNHLHTWLFSNPCGQVLQSIKSRGQICPLLLRRKRTFPCMQMDFRQFSRNNTCVSLPGKLLEIYLHAWLFSNLCGKVPIIVGI